jgi:hypothetical protein
LKKIIPFIILVSIFGCSTSSDNTANQNLLTSKVLIYDAFSKKIQRVNLTTGQLTPVSPAFDAFTDSYSCDDLHFCYHQASGCYYALDYNLGPSLLENQGRLVKYNKNTQTISYVSLSNYTRVSFLSEVLIIPNDDAYILDYDFYPPQARLKKVDLVTGEMSLYTTFNGSELNEGINSMTYNPITNSIYLVDDTNHIFYRRNFNDGFNYISSTNSNEFTNILYANNYLYTYDVGLNKIFRYSAGQSIWTAFSDEFTPFASDATYSHKEMNLIYNPGQNELIGFHDRSNKMY